jgi:hypothetical protein
MMSLKFVVLENNPSHFEALTVRSVGVPLSLCIGECVLISEWGALSQRRCVLCGDVLHLRAGVVTRVESPGQRRWHRESED